jgi:hypothetical protein
VREVDVLLLEVLEYGADRQRGQQERHGLGGAAKLEQCDTHPVQPVARQIDDHGTRGEGEHGVELAQGQLRISRVKPEKAELLVTVRFIGAGAGVEREGERYVEVCAGLVEPVGLVRDYAEQLPADADDLRHLRRGGRVECLGEQPPGRPEVVRSLMGVARGVRPHAFRIPAGLRRANRLQRLGGWVSSWWTPVGHSASATVVKGTRCDTL